MKTETLLASVLALIVALSVHLNSVTHGWLGMITMTLLLAFSTNEARRQLTTTKGNE